MAFLDNSGDIILDAVLTDTGRMRLAAGDGSFKIAKYAFGDDEIDYGSYNANHASGSAYYDLEILQTPILEAFTNNAASLKTKLITVSNNNLLYLPVIKRNTVMIGDGVSSDTSLASGSTAVLVDQDTVNLWASSGTSTKKFSRFLNGNNPASADIIRVDQGLDTTEISAVYKIDPSLKETQYIVEIDNRFASIASADVGKVANPAFIDDDNIASYYLSGTPYVHELEAADQNGDTSPPRDGAIAGPRGTFLWFRLMASVNLKSSDYLFNQVGSSVTVFTGETMLYIDSTIRIIGATTGYRVDIPVRFIKKD